MKSKNVHIEKYGIDEFQKEQKPYVMLLTEVIQKMPMQFAQAFLLWAYLESLPATWKPSKNHLTKHFQISDRTYERYMSWLNSVGLIEYRQIRSECGTFGKGTLIVLNGTRFNPDAVSTRAANIDGTVVNRLNKRQIVQLDRTAKLPLNGSAVERLNDAHINTKNTLRKEKEKKETTTGAVVVNHESSLAPETRFFTTSDTSAPKRTSDQKLNASAIQCTKLVHSNTLNLCTPLHTDIKEDTKDNKKLTTVDPNPSSSSFFSEKQKEELLTHKLASDHRTDELFLEHCTHHVEIQDNGLSKFQRFTGLKHILIKLYETNEAFNAKGYVKEGMKGHLKIKLPTREDFENYKKCVPGYEWVNEWRKKLA